MKQKLLYWIFLIQLFIRFVKLLNIIQDEYIF